MEFGASAGVSAEIDGLGPVRGLRRQVDRVAESDLAAMTDAELAQDLVALRTQADRIESVLAEMTMTVNRCAVGLADGYRSTPAWVRWKTGQNLTDVRRVERLGQVAELLPDTGQAWRAGEITSEAMDLIARARVAGAEDEFVASESEFLRLARGGDHRSLRIATEHFAKCARADGTPPEVVDGITLAAVGDATVVRGELHGTAAETLRHTLDVFSRPPSEHDSSTPSQRRAEALVRICEIALRCGTEAEGAKPSVSYVIRRPDAGRPGLAEGLFGAVLDPGERERVLCDCSISRVVLGAKSEPIDVGRSSPTWPVAIRKAIIARDRCCQWPGCEMPARWSDVHHVQSWEAGGETSVANGMLLCRRHHTFLHAHRNWRFTFDDQQFRAYRPDGSELVRERMGWKPLILAT